MIGQHEFGGLLGQLRGDEETLPFVGGALQIVEQVGQEVAPAIDLIRRQGRRPGRQQGLRLRPDLRRQPVQIAQDGPLGAHHGQGRPPAGDILGEVVPDRLRRVNKGLDRPAAKIQRFAERSLRATGHDHDVQVGGRRMVAAHHAPGQEGRPAVGVVYNNKGRSRGHGIGARGHRWASFLRMGRFRRAAGGAPGGVSRCSR